MIPLRCALLLMLALAPAAAQAAAGQVLFALGRVEVQRGGQALTAERGFAVEVGDTISTGPTGMAQVRLRDGALLSLRYGSTMKVEEFRMPEPAPAPVATPAGTPPPSAAAVGGRSVLRLLRGAFRTVTGLIGRSSNDAYSVVTPVATIGIRGTDYSAAYCSGDCGTTPDGLYVGVSNGGIDVFNDGGKLALGNDQYGYVKDQSTAPDQTLAPPDVLETPIEGTDEEEGEESGGGTDTAARDEGAPDGGYDAGRGPDTGGTQPEGDYEVRPGAPGGYAYASSGAVGSNTNGVYTDNRGALVAFLDDPTGGAQTNPVFVNIGTAQNTNLGFDRNTGLRWGRWHGGIANAGNQGTVDLTSASLHWIYASNPAPALAITGSRSYTLIGNTDPTDSNGATGFLGGATLFADFTNQVVDSTLNVGFGDVTQGGTLWQASGSGSIQGGTFDGIYDTVLVNGSAVGTSGNFSGFFTVGAEAAGLTFQLSDPATTVNGAVAFELNPQGVGSP